ncbi:MAG: TRAP transporter large permease [Bacteroidetes bacterium]|nr:TRAP transporter large permease [Bacteroidota bacterium]HET6244027.1 TRAP transporter large permease [Bacteroidia bacterium]
MELLIVLVALLVLVFLGAQLFLVIGGISLLLFYLYIDIPMFAVTKTMFDSVNKSALLAIPLYVFAGAIMARGVIAGRLIDLALSTFGWMKGGLAVASVIACIFFAAISGSSPVTLIAIGTIMYPALIKNGYPENLSLGALTVSGSLGILIPPSIPLIVFAMVTGANVNKLFIAGIVPGAIAGVLLMIMCLYYGFKLNLPTVKFSARLAAVSFAKGIPAIMMPVIILGGIYAGIYTVTEAAAVAAVYAIIIEMFVFREMKIKDLVQTLYDSVIVLGIIFIIIAMATVFNYFLTLQDIPFMLVDFMTEMVTSKYMFLFLTILVLLIAGLFMDVISAILILAPLLVPTALFYDVDLIHLGIIFILALEIGYMTPPIGINLFVSSGLFNKPFNQVVTASLPFMLCLVLTLALVTVFPDLVLYFAALVK